MRSTSLLAAAVATAPFAVSAAGTLGYALGARHPDGTCKTQEDYAADFAALKDTSTIIRSYAAIDGAKDGVPCSVPGVLLPAAQAAGFKVVQGLWADGLLTAEGNKTFKDELTEFTKYASDYKSTIYAVTVGSEALYRWYHGSPVNTTGAENTALSARIDDAKKALPGVRIGTADSWNVFADGTANDIIPKLDIILVNAFGYWQGQKITNATATYLDDLQQAFGKIQEKSGSTTGPELWNGETGWPSDGGSNYGDAVAGTKNAYYFWKQGVCAALDWGISLFYFSAFDEPWKLDTTGQDGTSGDEKHWGAFTSDRKPKFDDYSCKYLAPDL